MFLKTLQAVNFRNCSKLNLNFSATTLLIGDNAQGKSNLLESIYFLATTKSLRAEKDSQLIRQGEDSCYIEGIVDLGGERTTLEVAMQLVPETDMLEKRIKINGVPRRVSDYMGNLVVILFAPEDINLVAGSPSLRRDYLDLTLSQINREYKRALVAYTKTLTARNKLLKRVKEGEAKSAELEFWTKELIESGKLIIEKRQQFFQRLNEEINHLNGKGLVGKLYLNYEENTISEERAKQYLPREIEAAMTLIGPHRDDFIFELNGQDLAFFGSRGEQRTAVLDLKIAELNFIKGVIDSSPVLLLDDIFSELDETHRHYVTSLVGSQQTIITAVENEQIPRELLKSAKVLRVKKGKVVS